jgi:hypothetical protein
MKHTWLFHAIVIGPLLFTRSARADPTTPECLAAAESALSLRNAHKLVAARDQLVVCASKSCPSDVRKECIRRVEAVNASIPTVVFEGKDGSGRDLSAVRATIDGAPLLQRLDGSAVSVDPGEHAFRFESATYGAVDRVFVITEGEKDRRETILFGPGPAGTKASLPAAALAAVPPAGPAGHKGLGTQRTIGLAVFGAGVVGTAVGVAFGVASMLKHDEAHKVCPNACDTQAGVDLWNAARMAGDASTTAFIVGGVGLATGAVLWVTGKPRSEITADVRVGVDRVAIEGAF